MSFRINQLNQIFSLNTSSSKGVDFSNYDDNELKNLFHETLNQGMHGICFSAYGEGEKPGEHILNDAQVRRRLNILKPYTQWVRSFSCVEGNELIPKIAKEMGIKTLVGAWLGPDQEKNQEEIQALIQLAKDGFVDIAAVGNEVLYRNDLSKEELKQHIQTVRNALPNIPVGYVDAYYEFTVHPDLAGMCDVILSNCYPFWEGCVQEHALNHMQQMYHQAIDVAKGKKVIITETGWPSQGQNLEGAMPSAENFMKYFINTQQWCKDQGIEIFYFSSFDEAWKVDAEGAVGAYWGIWDKDENLKFLD